MIKKFYYIIILLVSFNVMSHPKTLEKHRRNAKGFAEVQVINNTRVTLLCYVAIDGHKIRFRLQPRQPSTWYAATHKGYNYKNFSIRCDYL